MKRASPLADQRPKHRRVDAAGTERLRRSVPHVSANALAAIMKFARNNDVSQIATSASAMRRSRDAALPDTPYGPMLVSDTLFAKPPHANKELWLINPLAYLYHAYKSCDGFRRFLDERHGQRPSSVDNPWRLCLYSDEVVPGNPLAPRQARKVWVIYFSFLDFHPHLHMEEAWTPIIAEPTLGLKTVESGIAQVFGMALKQFFGRRVFDMRSGIALDGPDGKQLRLFASFAMALQDGGAQKVVWGNRGDAATRFCLLCKNLVSAASGLAGFDRTRKLTQDSLNDMTIQLATNDDIKGAVKRLNAFKLTDSAKNFELRQQAIGFTYQQRGLLSDPDLESIIAPADQYMHDYMHCIFSSGVFNHVVLMCFDCVKVVYRNIWTVLEEYVDNWIFPRSVKFDPKTTKPFEDSRVKSSRQAGHYKLSASEGLSLLPVLCLFASKVCRKVAGVNIAACSALLAVGDLVDALQAVRHGLTTPNQLKNCVKALYDACEAAGWRDELIPKFHWLVHFPAHLERWDMMPSCWVHERKHKLAKRYATDVSRTGSFSKTVLSEVLAQQFYDVSDINTFSMQPGLIEERPATKKLLQFLVLDLGFPEGVAAFSSVRARTRCCSVCWTSDVALVRSTDTVNYTVGKIVLFLSVGGQAFALMDMWKLKSTDSENGCAVWEQTDNPALCDVDDLLMPAIWAETQRGFAKTLIPYEFRCLTAMPF